MCRCNSALRPWLHHSLKDGCPEAVSLDSSSPLHPLDLHHPPHAPDPSLLHPRRIRAEDQRCPSIPRRGILCQSRRSGHGPSG